MAWIWTLANALKFNLRLRHTSRQRRPTEPTPPDIVDRHGDLPAVKGIKNEKICIYCYSLMFVTAIYFIHYSMSAVWLLCQMLAVKNYSQHWRPRMNRVPLVC